MPSTTDEPSHFRRVAVLGAGLMGTNIALDFARSGREVTLTDSSAAHLERSRETLRQNLEVLEQHGMLSEPGAAIAARVTPCRSVPDTVCDADLVIEAVSEDLELKQELFGRLDFYSPGHAVLTSNTSSFMPTDIGLRTARQERIAVTHYFNPAHLIPLVELVPGEGTSPDTIDRLQALYRGMGKQPVVVRKERLGFVGNRLQFALLREAMALVEEGVATPADVDAVVRYGFGRRLPVTGVFHTADLAGLDTLLAICRVLFPDLAADTGPRAGLSALVEQGRLGAKTDAGWFDYAPGEADVLRQALFEELIRRSQRADA
jgi:3-hydroxybutyryl-CoA dehydrogenase